MIETWKDCVGFEGFYEVSDLGNVRRTGKNKHLAKVTNKDGYHQYVFSCLNKRKNVCGHQLVALAFLGPPRKPGLIPRHLDGNHTNNTPGNLRYGSNRANSQDAVRHGTIVNGSRHHLSKLTEQAVLDIRSSNKTQKVLADRYGVTTGNIGFILNRTTWKHI